jgi:hypothetical protein
MVEAVHDPVAYVVGLLFLLVNPPEFGLVPGEVDHQLAKMLGSRHDVVGEFVKQVKETRVASEDGKHG